MKSVNVVIGANYGDEGKGLITDYLSSKFSKPLVVRFNGGAQAGHTVISRYNERHVFHHFGSGTFAGAPTFLSKFFVVNPISYLEEYLALTKFRAVPELIIDANCFVTTPYDIMLNQAVEETRGKDRHGSCGMGFNETIQRNQNPKYSFTYGDLYLGNVEDKLNLIREEYIPQRLEELNTSITPYFKDDAILKRYLQDVSFLIKTTVLNKWDSNNLDLSKLDIIFEGAQGLALDMDSPDFPYVTRSKTGIDNVLTLLDSFGYTGYIDTYYVSRTYLTRHGAGPLANEVTPPSHIQDETNVTNFYQGHFRFACLDMDALVGRINSDKSKRDVLVRMALTCADQTGDTVRYYENNILREKKLSYFITNLEERLNCSNSLISFGPKNEDIKKLGYV